MANATHAAAAGFQAGGASTWFPRLSGDSTTYLIILGAIATILSVAAAATIQMKREQMTAVERIALQTKQFEQFVSHSATLAASTLDRTRKTLDRAVRTTAVPVIIQDPMVRNLIAVRGDGMVYWDRRGVPQQPSTFAGNPLFRRLVATEGTAPIAGTFGASASGPGPLAIAQRARDIPDLYYVTVLDTAALATSLQDIRGARSEALFITDTAGNMIVRTTGNSVPATLLPFAQTMFEPLVANSPVTKTFVHEGRNYMASAMQIPGYDLRVLSLTHAAEELSWTDYLPLWSIMIFGPSLLGAALAWALLNQMEHTARSRNALRRTEERFELAVSGARCGIWDWDVPNRSMYWSGAMSALLGTGQQPRIVRIDELENRLHPDDRRALRDIEESILAGSENYDETFRVRHEGGHYIWLRAKGQAYHTLRTEHPRLSGIALDISDQKQAAERLSVTERVLKAAFENAAEAFVLWDREGRLILCNRRFMEFYGLTQAKLGDARSNLLARVHPHDLRKGEGPLELFNLGGTTGTVELQRVDDRWLLVSERQATEEARIMVATDITALKKNEDALQASHRQLQEQALKLGEIATKLEREKQRAEEGSRSKTEFLANMSHELRTPLNAIMGFSDAMQNEVLGPLPPRYVGYARDIHASGEALLHLIDEVLNMARIESGQLELRLAPTDLSALVDEATHEIEEKAKAAGITLRTQLRDLPAVRADSKAIREVMSNLLSNALKFNSTSGYVTIETRMLGDQASVWIHDTGIGIAPENLPRVIKPFERIEKSTKASKIQGTGLGLAASNGIITRHGGRLTIESDPGLGTSVCFTLPLAA
ncbi:MAG: PAS domain-containing sensor histidine kinase [Alphaproteobacteria bacterium]|nr:PAS domain-containing sensor histidine kinase [Alphaproteobacteria bacterium]